MIGEMASTLLIRSPDLFCDLEFDSQRVLQ
jgi:hypothetical protein